MNHKFSLIGFFSYTILLFSCQIGQSNLNNRLLPTFTQTNTITPGSKGEQLTPGSKGEYNLAQLEGQILWGEGLEEVNPTLFSLKIDDQELLASQFEITLKTEPETGTKSLYYHIPGLQTGQNIVIDLHYHARKMSLMVPEVTENSRITQNIDANSTALVAVARRAENQAIRKLKAWNSAELAKLKALPELGETGQALSILWQNPAESDYIETPSMQKNIQSVLESFLRVLGSNGDQAISNG
jgi:hypothetical protein